MNHEGFEKRLALIRDVLSEKGLEASSIDPIDYDEKLPFPYNNFIYKVTLTTQTTPESFNNAGPYTVKPQPGITSFVVRLSNPSADGLNPANRVESEVASLHLARQGLLRQKPEIASVIPAIYAWRSPLKAGDAITQLGWIAMEFKHGVPLDMAFKTLTMSQKENVLGQLADVFGGVQKAPLPASIDRYGGVTIDGTGSLVPGQMTTLKGGPWGSYGSFWDNRISSQVEGADRSSIIGGWRLNGVRDRIDKLLEAGLEAVLSGAGVDLSLKTLIHGDLTMNNVLFDAEKGTITGLVDFDFASISHPCQEFFSSFQDVGGNTSGGRGPFASDERFVTSLLSGSYDIDGIPSELEDAWSVAKTWDKALSDKNVLKPSQISGIATLAQVGKLEGLLCPLRLVHPVFLKKMTDEDKTHARAKAEGELVRCLESLGF